VANARRKLGKIEVFAAGLAKPKTAQHNDGSVTAVSKRGCGMDEGGEDSQAGGATADVVRFPATARRHVTFDRQELSQILNLYGRHVATGEWRDYAMDFGQDRAVFSVFHRAAEQPLFRIVKDPSLARKQGQFSVIAQGGLILKRGQDLAQVLRVLVRQPRLAGA
jgi:hypothetical protein